MIAAPNRPFLRAVPALVAGMALLLLWGGCQPKRPPEAPETEPLAEDTFQQARELERSGALEQAYQAYEALARAHPGEETARRSLRRMAGIRSEAGRHEEALDLLERIQREFPDHPGRARLDLDILRTLLRMEDHDTCRTRGAAWLKRHAGSPLAGEAHHLLGRCEAADGRDVQAFSHWMEAAPLLSDSPERLSALDAAVHGLIERASLEDLEAMAGQQRANPYLPDSLQRAARLHMEQGNLTRAREAAQELLAATSSPDRQLEARRLLARVDEELSVRRGRIGCLLPLSGPYAIYGQEALNGIQMGAAPWLSSPDEPEVELVIQDTAGDPQTAVRAVEALVNEDQVMAVIGPLSSKVAEAAAARAQALGVPIVTLAQKGSIPGIGDMVFRNFLTPDMEVEALADHAFHELRLSRFGILYPDNPYGRYFMNLFWDRVDELGGTVTAVESYAPDKTDYADEVRKMVGLYHPRPPSVVRMLEEMKAESGVTETEDDDEPEPIVDFDAVFIPDNSERVSLVVPQLPFHRVLGVQLLGTSLWQSEALIELAGDYVQRGVLPSGFFRRNEAEPVGSFVSRYERSFGKAPDILAANGYDTIRYLRKLLADRTVLTREDLRRALYMSDAMAGVTGTIGFDAGGEVSKRPILLMVKGNRFVPVDRESPAEESAEEPLKESGLTPSPVQGVSLRSSR